MVNIEEEMMKAVVTSYIDKAVDSNLAYRPQFIYNDSTKGKKVLTTLELELKNCDEFILSVAFVTSSGLTPLLQTLKELEDKGIPGKVLTTNYLMFSQPKALKQIADFRNIELKMFYVNDGDPGFHTKGYIFRQSRFFRVLMGSSNLTLAAITKNKEWNVKILSSENGEIIDDILTEFEHMWSQSQPANEWLEIYTELYNKQKQMNLQIKTPSIQQYKLYPNKMQLSFIRNLKKLTMDGKKRALLISATGTGKTYASAFALRELNPKKVLFLVHREQIARQSMKSYEKVFGNSISLGLLSGNSKDYKSDYIFSTMQMMAKDDIRKMFKPEEFSIIIIDEVHRAGALSYQKIMEYFQPDFWLGMTASPDRLDGFDLYQLFDHNIAFEIRLQQALEEDLLCPFQYFGITDLEINGDTFGDDAVKNKFALLTSDERTNYVIEKARYFGFCGDRVKGLIFCSRKEEAKTLSSKFNERGFNTEVLTGEDSQEKRELSIEKLIGNHSTEYLDYIFTVDIFNEGVDIPEINQVIMLRPTESATIFLQQLGRGLRKAENKEYVVILDFIGNYTNNFMIPIALSGDRSYNKDTIRRYVMEGEKIIPGSSSIHFDEISKKRIFESIDKITTTKKLLTDKYLILKNKLGKIPSSIDFYEFGEIDPMIFIQYSGSYHNFLRAVDKDYTIDLSESQLRTLEFLSALVANGKRPHELIILSKLFNHKNLMMDDIKQEIAKSYCILEDEASIFSAINLLSGNFTNTQTEKKKYMDVEFLEVNHDGGWSRALSFYNRLRDPNFQKLCQEVLELGLSRYRDLFHQHESDSNLVLYQKYSRKDVCRLLNWEQDDSSTIYGYKIKNNTCPIFVTYKKKENIASSTKYEDHFENNKIFSWMTRSKVSLSSKETQQIIDYQQSKLKIYLFIKKSDGEGTDFYYMGQVKPIKWYERTIFNDAGKELPIMNFLLEVETAVRDDIYDYILS